MKKNALFYLSFTHRPNFFGIGVGIAHDSHRLWYGALFSLVPSVTFLTYKIIFLNWQTSMSNSWHNSNWIKEEFLSPHWLPYTFFPRGTMPLWCLLTEKCVVLNNTHICPHLIVNHTTYTHKCWNFNPVVTFCNGVTVARDGSCSRPTSFLKEVFVIMLIIVSVQPQCSWGVGLFYCLFSICSLCAPVNYCCNNVCVFAVQFFLFAVP